MLHISRGVVRGSASCWQRHDALCFTVIFFFFIYSAQVAPPMIQTRLRDFVAYFSAKPEEHCLNLCAAGAELSRESRDVQKVNQSNLVAAPKRARTQVVTKPERGLSGTEVLYPHLSSVVRQNHLRVRLFPFLKQYTAFSVASIRFSRSKTEKIYQCLEVCH